MSQYDFGTIDPNTKSGTALATDLNSWRNALHSTHGGSSAPSYITAGMLWLDTTSANYKLKLYDGAQSIDVGIIDATNNVARVAVDSAATSYITATTAAQIKFVIASVDTVTVRSTGLQFNIASPYIGDSSNNELVSFTATASAVNQIDIKNAATGTNPVISAVGNDTNIGITLTPKGTGRTNIGQLALDGTTITTTAAQLNFVTGVTSAIQTQIDAKAALAGPALTGVPTAPTAAALTNTTQIATTAFVLASSAPLASPAFTGTPTAPTASVGTNTTQLSTTAFVKAEIPSVLNASGSAPLYACRAWVNFNGTTGPGTIRGSGNVSSVTRNATGDYTVNFTTAMPDANYAVNATAGGNFDGAMGFISKNGTSGLATGSVRVFTNSGNNANNNLDFVCVTVFR
jgi:hypothetical protein